MPIDALPHAPRVEAFQRRMLHLPAPQTRSAQILLAVLVMIVGALYGRNLLLTLSFGDTDDAMRLVMVRDLIHGQPWFDHRVLRLQPPSDIEMHWSRLVDGGLAGLILLLRPFCGEIVAEQLVRTLWPLLWLLPAAQAAWSIAQRLAGPGAVGACALLLILSPAAFFQFTPGRIDHHDIQVVALLAALAGAVWMDRLRWAGWLAASLRDC